VVSVEAPEKYTTRYTNKRQELDALRSAPSRGDLDALCTRRGEHEIPFMNATRCFQARPRIIGFPWDRAVMFLTTYAQGRTGAPVNNDMLVLMVQGLTKDGRYAVNGHFDIRHPLLPDTMDDTHAKGRRIFDLDEHGEQAAAWLNRQRDDSFHPRMEQYVGLLSALEIGP
jgi:hypothetical protein